MSSTTWLAASNRTPSESDVWDFVGGTVARLCRRPDINDHFDQVGMELHLRSTRVDALASLADPTRRIAIPAHLATHGCSVWKGQVCGDGVVLTAQAVTPTIAQMLRNGGATRALTIAIFFGAERDMSLIEAVQGKDYLGLAEPSRTGDESDMAGARAWHAVTDETSSITQAHRVVPARFRLAGGSGRSRTWVEGTPVCTVLSFARSAPNTVGGTIPPIDDIGAVVDRLRAYCDDMDRARDIERSADKS
ncbi:hypothetical protein Q5752_004569 [Cryptotrichosporon argae]